LEIKPNWLRVVAQVNPLSYVVDLLRGYLVNGNVPNALLDWSVLLIAVLIVQSIASVTCQTIVL
jgi:ABC-2 type transport system permease protein